MRAAFLLAALTIAGCDRPAGKSAAENVQVQAPAAKAQAAAPAAAAQFPALSGRVVDLAELLPAEEETRLTQLLAALESRTTDQLVVVTVPSLNGRSIDAYANALFNHWGLGQADKDNGVMLLVAPAEQRTRIEVGFGLEPILTNQKAAEILERDMLPRFRENALAAGIQAGANAIVDILVEQQNVPRRGR